MICIYYSQRVLFSANDKCGEGCTTHTTRLRVCLLVSYSRGVSRKQEGSFRATLLTPRSSIAFDGVVSVAVSFASSVNAPIAVKHYSDDYQDTSCCH